MNSFKQPTLFHHHSCPWLRRTALPWECSSSPSWGTHSGVPWALCTVRGSKDEVKRDIASLWFSHICVCVCVCVCVRVSGVGATLEAQVSHQPSCCFSGKSPQEHLRASEGGDFLTCEHCDPCTVQRTLVEQHFGVFVCVSFRA